MASRNAHIQLGLMNLAVKLEVAVEKPVSFSNLCPGQPGHEPHDPSPLRMPKRCDQCGDITDTTVLVKGIKQGKSYVVVSQEEVAEQKEKFSAEYKGVLDLVPHPAQDFLTATAPGESIHYVTPADQAGANVYQMLVKLVAEHSDVAFAALYTPVSVTGLYMLAVRNGVLVLEQRTRTQALKPAPSVGGKVDDQLYKMLAATMDALMLPYDADAYEDGYAKAVAEMASTREAVRMEPSLELRASLSDTEETLRAKLKGLMKGKAA